MAAYIAGICSHPPLAHRPSADEAPFDRPPSLPSRQMMSWSEWRLEGAVYCSFDAFTRLDLRCEFLLPGGVKVCGCGRGGGGGASLGSRAPLLAGPFTRCLDPLDSLLF